MKTMRSIGAFLRSAWQFVFCFRKVFLAIPVIVTAIVLACRNASVLPERVAKLTGKTLFCNNQRQMTAAPNPAVCSDSSDLLGAAVFLWPE